MPPQCNTPQDPGFLTESRRLGYVLSQKGLNAAAVSELQDVKQTLSIALANPDANRPSFMDHAIVFLNLVKGELFSANPDDQFQRDRAARRRAAWPAPAAACSKSAGFGSRFRPSRTWRRGQVPHGA